MNNDIIYLGKNCSSSKFLKSNLDHRKLNYKIEYVEEGKMTTPTLVTEKGKKIEGFANIVKYTQDGR